MLIGKTLLKRYKIIEEIGGGGFGHTYKAIDTAFPGRPHRVVKHLSPKNKDSEALKTAERLFETEANALSRMGKNECIPELFAHFEEDGEFYLVQELVEGHNLSREFQLGRQWSEEQTVNFLRELLSILSVVHQENTIHRDIKPANIMRRDSDGKLVLIDFGTVKEILTVDKNGQTDFTVGIGSPTYMPFEQARGKPGKHSDVYAVGMLGIQALTGLTSYDLPHSSKRFKEIIDSQNIEISPQLESVLAKMTSYEPSDRYADAAEALQALPLKEPEPPEPPEPDPFPQPVPEPIPSPRTREELEETRRIDKPKFPTKLLIGALGGIVAIGGAGFLAFNSGNKPDYTQLETYLQNKEWQQADIETNKLILAIADEKSALDADSISEFPCEGLEKIDQLWTSNSDGKFGFTPQKTAYLETGNEFNQYTQSTYEEFGNKVKWRGFGVWNLYDNLNFTNIAPVGHLPSPGRIAADQKDLRIREREMLLSRFNACGL